MSQYPWDMAYIEVGCCLFLLIAGVAAVTAALTILIGRLFLG